MRYVYALAALVAGTAIADAQNSCPLIVIDGVLQQPTVGPGEAFGVTSYQCASCAFKREKDAIPVYSFSAEPVVLEVAPWSPLRPGDLIVSVNGQPITTRAGADQFTYPPEGQSQLEVRRDGARVLMRSVPRRECANRDFLQASDIQSVEILRGQAAQLQYGAAAAGGVIHIRKKPGAPEVRVVRPQPNVERPDSIKGSAAEGRFGFGLSCLPSCTRVRASDGTEYWKFADLPPIAGIRAGGPAAMAGLQVGDVVLKIDGISILSEEGALRFQRAERQDSIRLTILRDAQARIYLLRAR